MGRDRLLSLSLTALLALAVVTSGCAILQNDEEPTIPPLSDLTALYNFTHDYGTTVVDETGNGHDLIVKGSVPRVLEGTIYRRDFSGAGNNDIEGSDFHITNWTIIAVWKGNVNGSANNSVLIGFDNVSGSDIAPIFFWNNITELAKDGYKPVPTIGDYGSKLWENTTAWNAGQLYMTSVTSDDTRTTIWRGTVRQNYKFIGPVHPCDLVGKLYIGNRYDTSPSLAWNGSLYTLYIYDRVLRPGEISGIYNYEMGRLGY